LQRRKQRQRQRKKKREEAKTIGETNDKKATENDAKDAHAARAKDGTEREQRESDIRVRLWVHAVTSEQEREETNQHEGERAVDDFRGVGARSGETDGGERRRREEE
jgi:hypothetical protein